MHGSRHVGMADTTACMVTDVAMYMKSVRHMRSIKHCLSHGKNQEHGTRREDPEITRLEEAKDQEKEIGTPKEERTERQTQERSPERQHLQIVQIGTPFANLDLNAQTRTMGSATSCMYQKKKQKGTLQQTRRREQRQVLDLHPGKTRNMIFRPHGQRRLMEPLDHIVHIHFRLS